MMTRTAITALMLTATPATAAETWARSYPLRLGSHVLTVAGTSGNRNLMLDGKRVAEAVSFPLDQSMTVDGVPTAVIWADRGGASCYDGAMLLFAAPAGKPVVQGSVEVTSCQAKLHVGVANGEVVIVDPPVAAKPQDATPAVARSDGAVWLFDAKHGAVQVMPVVEPDNPEDGR
ncbi:hypothetical protein P7D22_14020 [Lichenihabitans sp. Uapishka_5]|uniref:hypothetical protein n=1 Tax=Lichenihabitans sp. Uapishka_5 TaxID=3037302 RepID=UPI0029E7F736|nr:hypothetical protein [Lichenihabitans sp. Uapishka_5]MDX7952288.1 hypothetical protein [Lichenihabitans sp. Uapishka_5]